MKNLTRKMGITSLPQLVALIIAITAGFLGMIAIAFEQIPGVLESISAVLFFAAIGYLLLSLSRHQPNLWRPHPRAEDVYTANAMAYGIGYTQLNVECEVNLDGSARVTRKVNVEAFSRIEQLDTFLLIPERIREGTDNRISHVNARSLTHGRDARLIHSPGMAQTLSSVIGILPPLDAGETFTYELTEELPAGLYVLRAEDKRLLKRQTPFEYFGWNINRPTRNMILEVAFPDDIHITDYAVEVRYVSAAPGIPADRRHLLEEKRLKAPRFRADHRVLEFEVDYPIIGLIYILRWQPSDSPQ